MFGPKKQSPISESLLKTKPVRYATDKASPTFRRSSSGKTASGAFGQRGVSTYDRIDGYSKKPKPARRGNGSRVEEDDDELENAEATANAADEADDEAREADERNAIHRKGLSEHLLEIKDALLPRILDLIDPQAVAQLTKVELAREFEPITSEVLHDLKITLNRAEQQRLQAALIDEIAGYGPLEVLLKDPSVSDILVNGPYQVYVERKGQLDLTDVRFRDDDHVLHVANRIVNRVGRRVDQTTPLCDARLEDGSRVNVIVPPLSLRGPAISIRKFSDKPITLDRMVDQGNLSEPMAVFLKAAAASRLNIVISGGTGSGKTTMLNALSKLIHNRERIVTIEDAAELRLQQPHVVSLETRPKNIEGEGEVTIRDLTINALRMRPDRIILGEVRGPECLDMLQAMNTGHEGSMCTLHANRPREALTRMENMVLMSGVRYPLAAIRIQIVEAIDLIVQVSRMRDGMRRVTSITEVTGTEGDVVVTQELFKYIYESDDLQGRMQGEFKYMDLRPACSEKLRHFGLEDKVMEALK